MQHIELPRALEDYFAYAESTPTRNGRRFCITLPYAEGTRMDRLQWWYHLSPAQEQMYEGHGIEAFRNQAIERFRRHIQRWLENSDQCLYGNEPIPRIAKRHEPALTIVRPSTEAEADTAPASQLDDVVNG